MDSYRSLIEKGNFKLVLTLTASAIKVEDLYYRMLALALSEDYEGALKIINSNKVDFINDIPNCRKELFTVHMHVLSKLQLFSELYKELDYYDSLPYLDYDFEEMIKEQKKNLITLLDNRSYQKESSEERLEEIARILEHPEKVSQEELILEMIDELRNYDIESIIPSIKKFLKSDYDKLYRTYLLLVLVYKGSYEEFEFSKNDIDYVLVPYELDPPFENDYYKNVIDEIVNLGLSPSVTETSKNIYNRYILLKYPENTLEIKESLLAVACAKVGCQILKEVFDDSILKSNSEKDLEIINSLVDDITYAIENDDSKL